MESKAKSPNKLLPVFHQGDDFDLLEKQLRHIRPDGTLIYYICISNSKGKGRSKGKLQAWLDEVYKYILKYNPNVKIHILGCMQLDIIEANY